MTEKLFSKNSLIIYFIIAGVLIGALLAAQLKSSVVSNSYIVDEINAQKDLLTSFDEDRTVLKNKITALRNQIEAKRTELASQGNSTTLSELERLKAENDLAVVRGEGLEITLSDGNVNKYKDAGTIHAADLRDLINVIRTTKSKAIAINGQRVTVNTTINTVGNVIMVNKSRINQPYVISAIGDPQLITSRLSDSDSYPDLYQRIKDEKVEFDTKKLSDMVISPADVEYSLKFTSEQSSG